MLKSSLSERDNPFRPGGTLDRESLEMIRSSTFSRSEVIIKDPAVSRANSIVEAGLLFDDGPVKPHRAVLVHFQSPIKSSPHVPLRRHRPGGGGSGSGSDDDDYDDDDDDDDEEDEDEDEVFDRTAVDNNNHVDHKSPNRVHTGPRLNGKTVPRGGSGDGPGSVGPRPLEDEVRAETLLPGDVVPTPGVDPAPPVRLEHVRLAKRRKCCHVM